MYIHYFNLINSFNDCIHTKNSNKSRIIIRAIELKYYIYIFNQLHLFNMVDLIKDLDSTIRYALLWILLGYLLL